MDPYIDGVVPQPITYEEEFFLSGLLVGNLRRIYAAHDDEGNDLSALPAKAADTRIANVRRDFLHKCSTTISQNHAIVCIEDLQVRNMSKSAAGSSEAPGKNVRAKSGLNKSILDQGWAEFRRQLEYKQVWQGGDVLAVPPRNTSRTCPCCGHVSKDNRKTQAKFECVECGYENNADLVGAINVLARGHRVLACGETAQEGLSMKQEPTEATTQGLALV